MSRGKTLENADFIYHVHFPKIFLNNCSTKYLKKNLFLKNFKSRLLFEGKTGI